MGITELTELQNASIGPARTVSIRLICITIVLHEVKIKDCSMSNKNLVKHNLYTSVPKGVRCSSIDYPVKGTECKVKARNKLHVYMNIPDYGKQCYLGSFHQ